jgi:hypothetical protein
VGQRHRETGGLRFSEVASIHGDILQPSGCDTRGGLEHRSQRMPDNRVTLTMKIHPRLIGRIDMQATREGKSRTQYVLQ